MGIIRSVLAAIWRGVSWLGSLLPTAPDDGSPPPDIDGRRPDGADPYAGLHANQHGKEGRGGFR